MGKEEELRNLARLFKQLGMHAVGEFGRLEDRGCLRRPGRERGIERAVC